MPEKWDIFRTEKQKKYYGVEDDVVRKLYAAGKLTDEDYLRPAGEKAWRRIDQLHGYFKKEKPQTPLPPTRAASVPDEEVEEALSSYHSAVEVLDASEEEEADFLAPIRKSRRRRKVEELDLTPMVDVTFLLLLFFMLTASYSMQKSIEVPAPDPEKSSQQSQSLEDLRDDYIIVTVEGDNRILVDDEPVPSNQLVERIRASRRDTNRNEMIIHGDPESHHETIVFVMDAANEVGMQRIRLANPSTAGP
ncbi:MAG: biopolymer transporter ExbD [Planctomycetota bacterium]